MNSDLWKGILMMLGLVLLLVVGGFALSDNGLQKVSCIGRAIGSGVAFGNIAQVCGLRR